MSYYSLPKPGKKTRSGEEIGPCIKPCKHSDCKDTREQAKKPCMVCGKIIGYENEFYYMGIAHGFEKDGMVCRQCGFTRRLL